MATAVESDLANSIGDLAVGPDMTVAVPGTLLAAGDWDVVATTTDDYAVVGDQSKATSAGGPVLAVALAGGTPLSINANTTYLNVAGKLVFTNSNVDQTSNAGPAYVWTASTGKETLLDNASMFYVAASADSAYITWDGNAAADGSTTDIFYGKSDGSSAKKVFAGVASNQDCSPTVQFAGSLLFVLHCDPPTDSGVSIATLHVVNPASGTVTQLATNLQPYFSVDTAGDKVMVTDVNGNASIVTSPGAVASAIGPVDDGFILPDGSAVIYVSNGTLYRTTSGAGTQLATGLPTSLYDPNTFLYDVSPDGKWFIYSDDADANTGFTELFLASTVTPGKPVTLLATATGAVVGDAFTADSTYAVFVGSLDPNTNAGQLLTQSVTGTASIKSGVGVSVADSAYKGTRVLFDDNFDGSNMVSTADLFTTDASKGGGALLVSTADKNYAFNAAKTKLVYNESVVAASAGLYVVTLP